ncbi:CHASE4 domain-containing protein, partial [Acinetobacter baumannii]
RVHVARFLQRAMESSAQAQRGVLGWDEAYARAVQTIDPAWVDREFGKFMGNAQGIGTILLVRPDGRLLRAWHDGRRTDDIAY